MHTQAWVRSGLHCGGEGRGNFRGLCVKAVATTRLVESDKCLGNAEKNPGGHRRAGRTRHENRDWGCPLEGSWRPHTRVWAGQPLLPLSRAPQQQCRAGIITRGATGGPYAPGDGVGGVEGVGHALGSGSTGCRSDDGIYPGSGLPPGDLARMEAHRPSPQNNAYDAFWQ